MTDADSQPDADESPEPEPEPEPRGKEKGVTGPVEYNLKLQCFDGSHKAGVYLHPTRDYTDNYNPVLECPECGYRVAVDTHVVPVASSDTDENQTEEQ